MCRQLLVTGYFSIATSCQGVASSVVKAFVTRHYIIRQPRSIFSCSFDLNRQTSRILSFRVDVVGAK